MIQVQIASHITSHGVDGIRWVLVEDADANAFATTQPASADAAPDSAGEAMNAGAGAGGRALLSLVALKSFVILAGMGAAFWVAHLWLGPPWPDSKAATDVSLGGERQAGQPSTQSAPGARPSLAPGGQVDSGRPAPGAPAASSALVVTAGWK